MLIKLIVYLAYFLKSSENYQHSKQFFFNLLENPRSKMKSRFDLFMICLVIISVFTLVYQVEHDIGASGEYLESVVVSIFIAEYILRLWLYSDIHKIIIEQYEKAQYLNIRFNLWQVNKQILTTKLEYVFSIFAIIDLLAILPSYRPLRILRIFLIFRLFKLFRYSNSIKVFADVLASKRFELFTLMVFMGFLVIIASIAIYLFENKSSGGQIEDLYDALYWSIVTISTVGYGDITPQTLSGRFITMALILAGLGVLSFFTSIIVAAFHDKMHTLRESRTYDELGRFKNFIIICGLGRVGMEVAKQLAADRHKFIVIDKDQDKVVFAKQQGYLAVCNDACSNEVLLNAGINRGATVVLCTTGNDVTNVYVTLSSRYLNKDIQIISRANRHENINKLYQAGANNVIEPFAIAGLLAAEYVGQPVAFEAISGILQEQKNILMETIVVSSECLLENIQLKEFDFAENKLSLVGVISTNPNNLKHRNKFPIKLEHFYFNPEAHFKLQAGDILVVLGREYSINHFRDRVEQSRILNKRFLTAKRS